MASDGEPESAKEKIGIMGGTFDPVHYGHLFAAGCALGLVGLDRVVFVPSGSPPHKRYDAMAPAEDRFNMTLLAVGDSPRFEASRTELDRGGASYTAETLEAFAAARPGAELFLITGIDAALDIPNWYKPRKILSLCTVVVVARPGYIRDKIKTLDDAVRKSLLILDTRMGGISATDIRRRTREGRSIRHMTPDAVCDYIMEKKLYSGAEAG